jgi:hypothetical protein
VRATFGGGKEVEGGSRAPTLSHGTAGVLTIPSSPEEVTGVGMEIPGHIQLLTDGKLDLRVSPYKLRRASGRGQGRVRRGPEVKKMGDLASVEGRIERGGWIRYGGGADYEEPSRRLPGTRSSLGFYSGRQRRTTGREWKASAKEYKGQKLSIWRGIRAISISPPTIS